MIQVRREKTRGIEMSNRKRREGKYARAMHEAIAKQIREGKLRSYYDPERRELIIFRPKVRDDPGSNLSASG